MADEKNFMMQFDGPLPPGLERLPDLEVEMTKDVAAKLADALGGGSGGGGGENVTVYIFFNTSTVTIEIDGEPATLVDSTDVPNAKELTAPLGTLASCTTTGGQPSVSIFPSLQEIIDDGDYLTQYIVSGVDEILMPVLPLATWSF